MTRSFPTRLARVTALVAVPLLIALPTGLVSTGTASAASKSGIRSVDFRNRAWDIGDGRVVTTVNGVFDGGSMANGDLLHFAVLDVDHGDLDGDGQEEAIVTTLENDGGTGQLTDAVVFRWNGSKAVKVTSHGIGDRADGGVFGVVIVGGVAKIQRYTNGQGACCPTEISTYFVKLKGSKLITAKPTTKRAVAILGEPSDPTPISFLPGTSSAHLSASGSGDSAGTIDAKAGQQVTITVSKLEANTLPATVRLLRNGSKLLDVGQGATGSVKLPASGRYTVSMVLLKPAPTQNDYAIVEADLTIK